MKKLILLFLFFSLSFSILADEKVYIPKSEKKSDYSDLNNKRYNKTKEAVQGDNKYNNNIYDPKNKNVRLGKDAYYIMTDVKASGGGTHIENINNDYRGIMTIEGTGFVSTDNFKNPYISDGWHGKEYYKNMWKKDSHHKIKHHKLTGEAGDDKSYVNALSDIFQGHSKPNTKKTQEAIARKTEELAYISIAKLQIAQENLKLLEEKYKDADAMDTFFKDEKNEKIFKQMAQYHKDLENAVIATAKLEAIYSQIGKTNSDRKKLEQLNAERLEFLASVAEFSQKLQSQNTYGNEEDIKNLNIEKLSYRDLENITFDRIYSLIQKGDKKSIADNMQILNALMKQNNGLFNYSLTALQGIKKSTSLATLELERTAEEARAFQEYVNTGIAISAKNFAKPSDLQIKKIQQGDITKSGTGFVDPKYNSRVAFEQIILGKN